MRKQKGQSIVEITLITPLLLAALYVPFDFGLALYTASLAQTAVRDVARKAATKDAAGFNATALQNEVTSRLNGLAGSPVATVTKLTTGAAGCTQIVQASVTYTYTYSWYKFARLFGLTVPNNSGNVTRSARMRYEFQPDSNGGAVCTTA